MNEDEISARIWLDAEIRELIGFANEQFGTEGIKYAVTEIARFGESLLKEELKPLS